MTWFEQNANHGFTQLKPIVRVCKCGKAIQIYGYKPQQDIISGRKNVSDLCMCNSATPTK